MEIKDKKNMESRHENLYSLGATSSSRFYTKWTHTKFKGKEIKKQNKKGESYRVKCNGICIGFFSRFYDI